MFISQADIASLYEGEAVCLNCGDMGCEYCEDEKPYDHEVNEGFQGLLGNTPAEEFMLNGA